MKGHNYGFCYLCGKEHIHPKGMLGKKHKSWNEGLTKEIDERVRKISESKINGYKEGKIQLSGCAKLSHEGGDFNKGKNNYFYGKHRSEEFKEWMRKLKTGVKNPKSSETRKRLIKERILKPPFEGKHHLEETKEKIRKTRIEKGLNKLENNPFYGKHHTEKNKKLMGDITKNNWNNPNSIYNNKEYQEKRIKAVIKGLIKRPTSFEQKIILLCSKYKLPFVYTGDGRVLIGYKNPDFVNEKDKIIIEVFLNYFKIRDFGSIENYIDVRGKYFIKRGYKVIFIREEEITDKNWEQICLNKIKGVN